MKCNVGKTDQILRLTAGVIIAGAGVLLESYWGLIGVALIATGLFQFCAVYTLLGINTKK